MSKIKCSISFLLLCSFTIFSGATIADPAFNNAWVAETAPGSKVMVAYMNISNPTSEDIEIVKISSEIYSSIEMHETIHNDGIARMVRHKSISIPASGSIVLERGAKHLMLFNPKKQLKAGDQVTLLFETEDNKTFNILVPVKKMQF